MDDGTLESQGSVEHRFPNAHRLSGQLDFDLMTEPHPVAGRITYGASASYLVPVWRNRNGTLFELRAEAEGRQLEARRASVREQRKRSCSEAIRRYVDSYVARRRLEVYRELLEDKVRMFNQTSADYQEKMVTRLDYLAARSDWLEAKSREAEFVEALDQADARLRTYAPVDDGARLKQPKWDGISIRNRDKLRQRLRDTHPELNAIDHRIRALEARKEVIREELEPGLDIGGSAGVGRFHDTVLASGRPSDVAPQLPEVCR